MTVSPVPPSLDMTVTCTSGVIQMSTQPPVVTSVPAMSTATINSREIDVSPGPSDVDPVPRLGPASSSVGRGCQPLCFLRRRCPVHQLQFWCGRVSQPSTPFLRRRPVSRPLLLLRRWLGGMRVTRRYPCFPIVFRQGALRTFRSRAVSFMCRQFRRDFCLGHQGMLSSFHRRGYCCR